jgi:UDP-N-acetylmuramoyl-L-alanyl-D-glutamate--2,6-diaminopimelate ligase
MRRTKMRLKKILKSLKIIDSNVDFDTEIENITSDSRKISNGSLFVAIKGTKRDGNLYIYEALNNGAKVIVTENKEYCVKEIPYILVESARGALSLMLSAFYGNPTIGKKVIAITGTNGKTSTAYFLYSILRKAKKNVGLISTIECLVNEQRIDLGGGSELMDAFSAMTTPDSEKLYYLFNIMKEKNVEYIVLEASSHALDQKKLLGTHIDIGIFTNLSSEHMDYHGDIESYFKAKEELFKICDLGIVNIDDEYGKIIYEKYKEKSCSFSCKENADYIASNIALSSDKTTYNLNEILVETSILGDFSVYNSALAYICGEKLGLEIESLLKGILSVEKIKGRLEKFKDKSIYIDYAHTPTATEEVLKIIKGIEKNKRIVVLFGCGGDRDKTKREKIGKICSKYADILIITSDNARSEEPISIIKDIIRGIDKNKTHIIIPNRRDAILYATKILNDDSVLVLLGKGHEEYEIDKNGKHYFNERDILKEAFCNG